MRKKYYGSEHARDPKRDLKGKDLLSNYALKLRERNESLPRNLCIVKELLSFPHKSPNFYLRAFASTVFSSGETRPDLLSPDPKKLSLPFRRLVENVSHAATEEGHGGDVRLILDQRLGAQEGLAISLKRFVAGMHLRNIHPYPYFAVSHVSPGVQIADVFAHLLSKRAQKRREVFDFYNDLKTLQWESQSQPKRYGFVRFDEHLREGERSYRIRDRW